MKSRAYIIIGGISALLLLASCGQQYHAEKTVEDFVEANMEEPSQMSYCD